TQFLREHLIVEEVVNYRPQCDPKGLGVTKKRSPKAQVDSDANFDGDDGEDSEMREVSYAPTDDED
ncbi:hypothetical protein HAX54_052439, partial [Datura stramonium]|nr:hypothetical protein [Datura stramonium]